MGRIGATIVTVFEAARQADCVQAAERLGLRIRRSGSRAFTCCLFHAERTPSMCFYPGNGGFYCFGCHAHGDAIALYAQSLNCTSLEAARQICRDFGFQYDEGKRRKHASPQLPARRADAWALAKRLDAMREKQADALLARLRSAQAAMEQVEATKADPDAVMDDTNWQRAMREQSTAQEQLAMLDGMTLAEFLEHTKQETEERNEGRRDTGTRKTAGGG